MKREFIFLGPPACGKGTQTSRLAQYLNLPHVDTGSLLRNEIKNGTENGLVAKSFIDKGQLVPVELVANIIKNRLAQKDCENGYILDGFPRSIEQAHKLELINKDLGDAKFMAIYFDLDSEILISRIVNRRSCPNCGETVLAHTVCTACGQYKGKVVSRKSPDFVETPVKKSAPKKATKKVKEEVVEEVKQEIVEEKQEEATTEEPKEEE